MAPEDMETIMQITHHAKLPLTNGTTRQNIARVPRNLYRAQIGGDGLLLLDQPLRGLLHLDDAGGLA
jgi:hypothetical protein